jgi:hypothetical protein
MSKKLTAEEIDEYSKDPYQAFDICSVCSEVELEGEMNSVSEESFDQICNDCKKKVNNF